VSAPRHAPDPQWFCGTWSCSETTARYRIAKTNGAFTIHAWDAKDGEEFEVTDTHYADGILYATFRLPSEDHVTHSRIELTGQHTLEERCTGDWTGTLTWEREKARPRQAMDRD